MHTKFAMYDMKLPNQKIALERVSKADTVSFWTTFSQKTYV